MEMINQLVSIIHVIRIDRDGYGLKGTQSGLFQTDDSGETWQTAGIDRPVTALLQSQGKILAGGAGAIYLSEDQGVTWQSPQALHPPRLCPGLPVRGSFPRFNARRRCSRFRGWLVVAWPLISVYLTGMYCLSR